MTNISPRHFYESLLCYRLEQQQKKNLSKTECYHELKSSRTFKPSYILPNIQINYFLWVLDLRREEKFVWSGSVSLQSLEEECLSSPL